MRLTNFGKTRNEQSIFQSIEGSFSLQFENAPAGTEVDEFEFRR